MKTVRYAALALLLLCVSPRSAGACECFRIAAFEEAAKSAAIVFTGKVVATHLNSRLGQTPPDYVDVEVVSVARGDVTGVVRVWDILGDWSCGGGLRGLGVDMRVEFAVGAQGSWEPSAAKPGSPVPHPTALYSCGKPWRYAAPTKRG